MASLFLPLFLSLQHEIVQSGFNFVCPTYSLIDLYQFLLTWKKRVNVYISVHFFCSTPEHEKYTYGNSATFLYRISDIWLWFKKSCLGNIGHLLLYHNFKQNEQAVDVSFHYSSSFSRISLTPAAPGIWIRIWYCVRSLYHDEKNRHDFKLQSSMKLKFV